MFADDTVIFGNSKEDLQLSLNVFGKYCDDWKLTVNISKTKVMVFLGGRAPSNLKSFLCKCKYTYILYCQIGFGRHRTCILCKVTSTRLLNVIHLHIVTSQIVSGHACSKFELIIV